MALLYLDASALVKLLRAEPETEALHAFLAGADLVSCELVLTEVPRAVRRACADDPGLPLDEAIARAGEVLDALARALGGFRHVRRATGGGGAAGRPAHGRARRMNARH